MLNRTVTAWQAASHGEGTVVEWAPLGSGMCDTLVRFNDGYECWFGSNALAPADGLGPLPSRAEARGEADAVALSQLQRIRASHMADFHRERWPGMEFGKAHFGQALNAAIAEVKARR